MNKIRRNKVNKLYGLSTLASFFICLFLFIGATNVNASTVLVPHLLTTGTESDATKNEVYQLNCDGSELIPLQIKENGYWLMNVVTERAGFVNIGLYTKADGSDFPEYLSAQCTEYNGKKALVERYMEKGTYYLKFPQNNYRLEMQLYSNEEKKVTVGKTFAAYCDYNRPAYSSYTATQNGYVSIEQKWLRGKTEENSVTLCDSKGNSISDAVCDHKLDEPIIFPVKKGKKYKFMITTVDVDGKQFYQMNVKFFAREDHGGSSRPKATSFKMGKDMDGIAYAEDSTTKNHWYKFTNPKAQKIKLTLSGEVSSGSLKVLLFNPNYLRIGTKQISRGPKNTHVYNMKARNKSLVLPKGTYYIRVVKSQKTTSGIYTIKVKAAGK